MLFENLEFLPMKKEDIEELTPIMKRAFDDDTRLHSDQTEGGPDGYDDGSFLLKWGIEANSLAYRVNLEGKAIGALILFLSPDGKEGFLGNIFVDSALIGHGYGSAMWRFVEQTYPDVEVWHTETPAVSYRNHCFYINKLGFHVVKVEGGRNEREDAQFCLEKDMRK